MIRPSTDSSARVDTIVVSVGPYALKKRRPGAQRATRSAVEASPPTLSVRSESRPVGSTDPSTAGVMTAWVTFVAAMSARSSAPP